jgi:hypothetical protein
LDGVFNGREGVNVNEAPSGMKSSLAGAPAEIAPPAHMKKGWAGVLRLGGLGDSLIAASTLRPLKAVGYKIDMIAQMPHAVVFENNPFIDKLTVANVFDLPQNDILAYQAWFRSKANDYERFANLTYSCEGMLALFPASTQFHWPAAVRRKM